jgi:hypothetical protein
LRRSKEASNYFLATSTVIVFSELIDNARYELIYEGSVYKFSKKTLY